MLASLRPSLLTLDWLVALAWFIRTLQWSFGLRRVPDLLQHVLDARPKSEVRRLSVIVPACNEATAIEACLRSLLASTGLAELGVLLEVIAINDRSTDMTGKIMERIANESPSKQQTLRVLHITELPVGWMGKTHAMALAAAEATGDYLLFTDGDILYHPEALARAFAFAEQLNIDHLILYPTMIFKTFGERMMLSFLHALSIWGMRPWKVSDPTAKNDYIGIGAFNMVRRSTYNAIGGWSALRLEVLEDLRMGYTIKRTGFRQSAVFGRELIQVRWAEGALGVVNNMSKNLFALFRFRLLPAITAAGAIFAACLCPILLLSLGRAAFAPCALMLIALILLSTRFHRLGLPNVAYVFTFPIGATLFLFALVQSIFKTLRQKGINWRGTFYPLSALRKHAGPLR